MRLHDLLAREQRLIDLLDESSGELTPEIEALMALMEAEPDSVASKADGYRRVIDTLTMGLSNATFMEHRFRKLRQSRENALERVKVRLLKAMVDNGVTKIQGTLGGFDIRKNSQPSCKWIGDLDAVPIEFRKATWSFSATQAREWVERNRGPLPHGLVVDHGQHLHMS